MRWCPALVLCLLASWPAGGQAPVSSAPDEAAIREVVRNYVDARDKRDPKLLASLFTEDADQLTTAGEWRKGRDNVVQGGLASSQANPGGPPDRDRGGPLRGTGCRDRGRPLRHRRRRRRAGAADADDLRDDEGRRGRLAHRRDPQHGPD